MLLGARESEGALRAELEAAKGRQVDTLAHHSTFDLRFLCL